MNIQIMASGSKGNCYRVDDGKSSLLLDAGIALTEIRKHCTVGDIGACLITHEHGDHSKAMKDLAKYGVDIYASQGTHDAVGLDGHRIKAVERLQKFSVDSWEILPFDVQHDAAEPLGFLLESKHSGEKLLYFTDTYYIRYTFSGLTHIMAECNYSIEILRSNIAEGIVPPVLAKRLFTSHMSLENLLGMFVANDLTKVRQIYLLHLSDRNSDERLFKDAVQKATGAEVYVCQMDLEGGTYGWTNKSCWKNRPDG